MLFDIIFVIGAVIFLISSCCIDSTGIYGYVAGAACILGLIIIIIGFLFKFKNIREKEVRKKDFYNVKRKDRLGADVEFLDGSDTTNVL